MFPADPSKVRQAPDAKALMKSVLLVLEGQELSTPPMAQEYFEPGINVKHTRRSKPRTDYSLPSDMPTYPLGFVPINQTPGANGEEPPEIRVKESVPADLMDVFARINAEETVLASLPKYGMDVGSLMSKEYTVALREAREEKKLESMLREGYTQSEAAMAMSVVRAEEAVKEAKAPVKPTSLTEVLAEAYPEVGAALKKDIEEEKDNRPPKLKIPAFMGRGRRSDAEIAAKAGQSVEEIKMARKAKRAEKMA